MSELCKQIREVYKRIDPDEAESAYVELGGTLYSMLIIGLIKPSEYFTSTCMNYFCYTEAKRKN